MWRLHSFVRSVIRPIANQLVKRVLDSRICSVTGLVSITRFAEEDVFVVGYPKSGNTWFQNLIVGIVYGVDPKYAPDTLVQDLVPDVQYKRHYRRYRTPMFFKSHHLPHPEYGRVVYLLRDGRDVMVSYYHHNVAFVGEVDFLRMVKVGEGIPCKWHEHVEAWLCNPYNAQMLIIKYEDLKENILDELQRFCAFVGVEREREFLERAAEGASFEVMHYKEVHYGWGDSRWPKDKPFVRRGQVGSYKDEMPHYVMEAFLSDAEATLRKCGYLSVPQSE